MAEQTKEIIKTAFLNLINEADVAAERIKQDLTIFRDIEVEHFEMRTDTKEQEAMLLLQLCRYHDYMAVACSDLDNNIETLQKAVAKAEEAYKN